MYRAHLLRVGGGAGLFLPGCAPPGPESPGLPGVVIRLGVPPFFGGFILCFIAVSKKKTGRQGTRYLDNGYVHGFL